MSRVATVGAASLAADLPADFTDPLHLLEPTSFPWGWLPAMILLALLLKRLLRRSSPPEETPVAEPTQPRPAPADGLRTALDELRRLYSDRRDWRGGCHALAAMVRQQLDLRNRVDLTMAAAASTVSELEDQLGDSATSRYLDLLADLQFRRREPSEDDFHGACDLASSMLTAGSSSKPLL